MTTTTLSRDTGMCDATATTKTKGVCFHAAEVRHGVKVGLCVTLKEQRTKVLKAPPGIRLREKETPQKTTVSTSSLIST